MSKERELKELLAQPDINTQYLLDQVARLTAENAMLKEKWSEAQPEQTEQEPVAWMQDSIELYVAEEKSAIRGYVIPLYTAPPKREPLSDEATSDMFHASKQAVIASCYWAGIRDAEKAHGITGVDDEK